MTTTLNTRDAAVVRIRKALRARSDKTWSVTAGRATSADWIRITAPRSRRVNGVMQEADAIALGKLLGLNRPAYAHGEEFPANSASRVEYIDRAEGRVPSMGGSTYRSE
jgi:hypothetical protein